MEMSAFFKTCFLLNGKTINLFDMISINAVNCLWQSVNGCGLRAISLILLLYFINFALSFSIVENKGHHFLKRKKQLPEPQLLPFPTCNTTYLF